jgi:hypothetical protein
MRQLIVQASLLAMLVPSALLAEPPSKESEPRKYHEIYNDMRTLLKMEATAASDAERVAVIHEMLPLYRELATDPRLALSPTLQKYRIQLRSRLMLIQARLKRQLARRPEQAVRSLADLTTDAVADQLSLVGSTAGGPGRLFAAKGAFGGGARRPDYGQALVELIQNTIAPDSWDVRGGAGVIVYYAPLHCLVVRATSEVHHRIGGAVGVLRKVGN